MSGLGRYTDLVAALQAADYRFVTFPEAAALPDGAQARVAMRHDVDIELEAAAQVAAWDQQMGVVSTFFVLLRTEHYNVLSPRGSAIVAQILGMGHRLGLHFDPAAYAPQGPAELNAACRREAEILGRWFGATVDTVSFHRPPPWAVGGDPALTAPLWHTYAPAFTQRMHYCSDSRGVWGHGAPLQAPALAARRPLHLLTHPIWWAGQPPSPGVALAQAVRRQGRRFEASLAAHCAVPLASPSDAA